MGCGEQKLSKYLTQTFTAYCNVMICQQATLSGEAERPKVADAVIEADFCQIFILSIFLLVLIIGIGKTSQKILLTVRTYITCLMVLYTQTNLTVITIICSNSIRRIAQIFRKKKFCGELKSLKLKIPSTCISGFRIFDDLYNSMTRKSLPRRTIERCGSEPCIDRGVL